jgi:hypothetical protein
MLSKSVPHNPVGHLVAEHPSLVRLARAGWLAKGVVYLLAGVRALVIVARSFPIPFRSSGGGPSR